MRIPLLLLVSAALSACAANSPFTPASAPEPGKIPVHVVASASTTGSAGGSSSPDYNAGVQVVFGKGVPESAKAKLLKRLGLNPGEARKQ